MNYIVEVERLNGTGWETIAETEAYLDALAAIRAYATRAKDDARLIHIRTSTGVQCEAELWIFKD